MISFAGSSSLLVAFLLAVYGIVALVYGRSRRDDRWLASGRTAALSVFAFVSLAVVLLEVALLGHDFSIRYVADNTSLTTPFLFRTIALWGALEGSILFWQWVLALFLAIVVIAYRRRYPDIMPYVISVLLGISGFFLILMLGPANPFASLEVPPPDGRGLNPLLQNHPLMAVHPPFLYLGYVGFSVPYAFAMGSLLAGQLKDEWMTITRRWTLLAWTFLTGGLFLGARWSYDVLGWGGYWAWDPVENAAFMPWLVATALVHSVMVQERRQLLRVWNLVLVILTFLLTVFGTFLTRSGVIGSVHSFTQSLIGPLFLAFLVVVLAFSLTALLRRLQSVRDEGTLETYLAREALMLVNNVILLTMAFTVFLGTIFPLLVEATSGAKVTVGPPFFNRLFVPLGLALLLTNGVGTVLRWGRSSRDDLRRLLLLLAAAILTTAVLASVGVRGTVTLAGLCAVLLVAFAQLSEFYRGTRTRQAATGEGLGRALLALFSSTPQRYYGYLTHLGLAVALIGIIGSVSYRVEIERTLAVSQSVQIGQYTLRYDGLEQQQRPDRLVIAARLTVLGRSAALAATSTGPESTIILTPSENFFPHARTPIATPAVRSSWREDLYVVLMGFDLDGHRAVIKAIVTPLVSWIWMGGLVMVIAGVLNVWPSRHRRGATRAP